MSGGPESGAAFEIPIVMTPTNQNNNMQAMSAKPRTIRGFSRMNRVNFFIPLLSSLGVPNPRIEQRVNEIENQCGKCNTNDDEEHDTVDGEVVECADGSKKDRAHTRVVENHFDQQGAG